MQVPLAERYWLLLSRVENNSRKCPPAFPSKALLVLGLKARNGIAQAEGLGARFTERTKP